MSKFIFRNNTVEHLFDSNDILFSGYGDISGEYQSADISEYVWFYDVPMQANGDIVVEMISNYIQQLSFILPSLNENAKKVFISLSSHRALKFEINNDAIEQIIEEYNLKLKTYCQEHNNAFYIDIAEFYASYKSSELINWKYYYTSQIYINPMLAQEFKTWYSRMNRAIDYKRKKCLVLDLDNTMWGGIIGEDGMEGIQLGNAYPGNTFVDFQSMILEASKKGVILSVCSKNNEKDALAVFENHPDMVIKKEHIVYPQINWNNKAENISKIAKELNIGLDSIVFIDDNPVERNLVKSLLPDVTVPDFPSQPYELRSFFENVYNEYFGVYTLLDEDKSKLKQYKANIERKEMQSSSLSLDDYLKNLNTEVAISALDDFNLKRIAQMTQKTNQFNLTTRRYTESDISAKQASGDEIFCISVKDKFGDSGITGAIILEKGENNSSWNIDTFLLSCRVLGRNIEQVFLLSVLNKLVEKYGEVNVHSEYLKTLKNEQVESFYENNGFELINSSPEQKEYKIQINDTLSIQHPIKVTFS